MRTDKEIWQEDYVQPMFKKYECVPTKLKYMFIEKDFIKMLGATNGKFQVNMMSDDSDSFIFAFDNAIAEFGKVVSRNLIKKYWEDLAMDDYIKIAQSGSYFKYYSGKWKDDKQYFIDKVAEKEREKEYVKFILDGE